MQEVTFLSLILDLSKIAMYRLEDGIRHLHGS